MEKIRNDFNPPEIGPCVVRWDGKLLPALSGKQMVDRLLVIILHNGTNQLLGVPELRSVTGENQATAVYQELKLL